MNSRLPGMCKRSPHVCTKLRWPGPRATPSQTLLTLPSEPWENGQKSTIAAQTG